MPWSTLKPRERTILRYLLLVVAGGLLLMSVRSLLGSSPSPATAAAKPERPVASGAIASEEAALDSDLASVLGRVAGAGTVQVRVALAASDAQVYAVDTTAGRTTTQGSQTGQTGSTQTQESTKTVTLGNSALPVRVDAARVSSVLVVASGAATPTVRAALAQAAAAALGVPIYRVVVLAGAG